MVIRPAFHRWSYSLLLLVIGILTYIALFRKTDKSGVDSSNPFAERTSTQHSATVDKDNEQKALALNKATQDILDKPVPEIRFQEATLSDAISFLHDQLHINIEVNWEALKEVGISPDVKVSTRLRNVKGGKAIKHILGSISDNDVLNYKIRNGIVNVSTSRDLAGPVVTRSYDIRDLIITIPDFSVFEPEESKPASRTRDELVDQLINLVRESIGEKSWQIGEELPVSINEIGGQLIVTNTEEVHDQIVQVLEKLRDQRSTQITIETRFLTIDSKLVPEKTEAAISGLMNTLGEPTEVLMKRHDAWLLSDDQVNSILASAKENKNTTTITTPRLTAFNGQLAGVSVEKKIHYVSGYTSATQPTETLKWVPQINHVNYGIKYGVRPSISSDRKRAILYIQSVLTRLEQLDSKQFIPPDGTEAGNLFIQLPKLSIQKLHLGFLVPDGATLLVGGMTWPIDGDQKNEQPVFLLIKPTIIIQKENEQDNFPLLREKKH